MSGSKLQGDGGGGEKEGARAKRLSGAHTVSAGRVRFADCSKGAAAATATAQELAASTHMKSDSFINMKSIMMNMASSDAMVVCNGGSSRLAVAGCCDILEGQQ